MTDVLRALKLTPDSLDEAGLTASITALYDELRIRVDDYPRHAQAAVSSKLSVEEAYAQVLKELEEEDCIVELEYHEKSKDYLELHQQIETSTKLIGDLCGFLNHFQNDLSSVSTSIAELQRRSKLIDSKLEGRKELDSTLNPYISSIIISPDLIQIITSTKVSEIWLSKISELDERLKSIRSEAKVGSRQELDQAAEKLRLMAAYKIRDFFITILTPFRCSISTNLHIAHSSIFMKYRPLYTFLQHHAARIAHEVQKAYVGSIRWYFETGFRRYIRCLELVKSRGYTPPFGNDSKERISGPVMDTSVDSGSMLLAYMAADPKTKMSLPALFRSLSLIVVDNVTSEFNFVLSFFGQPSTDGTLSPPRQGSSIGPWDLLSRVGSKARSNSIASSIDDRESMSNAGLDGHGERRHKSAHEFVWKQVVEPVLEYHRIFTLTLIAPTNTLSTVDLYCMVRLNDALLSASSGTCSSLEGHLMEIKMMLWPLLQTKLNNDVTSMKQMSGGTIGSGSGLFGTSKTVVKDGNVKEVALQYANQFNVVVAITPVGEDEKIFGDLLKLREALSELVKAHVTRMTKENGKSFVSKLYDEVLAELSVGATSHPRSQTEVAHWRELRRKIG